MKSEKVKKIGFCLAVTLFICTLSLNAFGQKATRIKFARGATSAIVTGTLDGFKGQRTFVIRVRAGRTLSTEGMNRGHKYITIGISGPPGAPDDEDSDMSCHAAHEITPTLAGDYEIGVTECMKADAWKGTFRFRVTVR